jgi:enamine deaminase RidA (YjgF/YER057c/UK114 family)
MDRTVAVKARLERLELELPPTPTPLANYLPARRWSNQIIVSGQLPIKNQTLMATGRVGEDVSQDLAMECAQQCFLNALAAATSLVRLEDLIGVIKITGFVSSAPDFFDHAEVINGASNMAVSLFEESGKHARAAVGVYNLPKNAPVEVEVVFGVKERG